MSSLLLIGGSGFFGKSFLDAYQRGLLRPWNIHEITVLSRRATTLAQSNPDLLDSSIRLINSDIATATEIPSTDYVIHAAASTDAARYLSQPLEERKNIQAGTLNFCKLAKLMHSKSKIVYASSGAVYGQQSASLKAIDEGCDLSPIEGMPIIKQDYAAAKRDGESAIHQLGKDGVKVSIARCFAFIGAYLPRDQHFAIGNFIDDGLHNRPILVKANHAVYRSYMYVDDLVGWLMTIADNSSTECPIYNVGSDESILIGDLAKKIGIYFGVECIAPNILVDAVDRYVPSIKKAKSIGLNIEYDLNRSIDLAILSIKNICKK